MKLNFNGMSRTFGRSVLKTKANSPHIFFGLGVVGVVAGAVLASKATLQLEEKLDEVKADFEGLKNVAEEAVKHSNLTYTEQDYHKDLGLLTAKSAVKLGRLYAPAIVVGGFGIAALTGSHVQLTKRNTALTITLAAVSKAYDDYRTRVREELGEETERHIYQNAREETIEVDGKKETVQVIDPNGHSVYARCFDVFSSCWEKDAEVNRIFIECQQKYMNHILQIRGHVMLNDVYDKLGLERTPAGAVVGWVYQGEGDNFIDFDLNNPSNARFLAGYENAVWLDFNVDGVVYEQIGKGKKW